MRNDDRDARRSSLSRLRRVIRASRPYRARLRGNTTAQAPFAAARRKILYPVAQGAQRESEITGKSTRDHNRNRFRRFLSLFPFPPLTFVPPPLAAVPVSREKPLIPYNRNREFAFFLPCFLRRPSRSERFVSKRTARGTGEGRASKKHVDRARRWPPGLPRNVLHVIEGRPMITGRSTEEMIPD